MIEKENQMLTEAYMYKILIVEDDSTITAVLKRTLENGGMRQRQFQISAGGGRIHPLFSGFGAARYLTAFF